MPKQFRVLAEIEDGRISQYALDAIDAQLPRFNGCEIEILFRMPKPTPAAHGYYRDENRKRIREER